MSLLATIYPGLTISTSREVLDGLRNRGFKLNEGILGTGFALLAWNNAGGYYLG